MELFNYSEKALKTAKGYQTALEISHQPEVWALTAKKFTNEALQIIPFIQTALKDVDEVLLTGAGSSSFIGHCLSRIIFKQSKLPCSVVPTTDMVSFPDYYFNASRSALIISFARSGNSPESVASLQLADKYNKKCYHLIITCDKSGALAHYHSGNPALVFLLPEESNDKGLAMTGSYSAMLLVGLLLIYKKNPDFSSRIKTQIDLSMQLAENMLHNDIEALKTIAERSFKRAIFLGAGPLHGTAMEAALKVQELTNGNIVCKSDTFLGFRHGPRVVVNKDSLMVYFFSNNKYAHQYEIDLIHSMNRDSEPPLQIGVGNAVLRSKKLAERIPVFGTDSRLTEAFQPLSHIIPAQLLGFFKSMKLGLRPDNPSLTGAISRVVKGVNIYPFEN